MRELQGNYADHQSKARQPTRLNIPQQPRVFQVANSFPRYAALMYTEAAALSCVVWYVVVVLVCSIGTIQLFRHFSKPPPRSISSFLSAAVVPHVTIIRPCRGIEPYLYECLASTCYQDYPNARLTVHLCVVSRIDAAFPVLLRLARDYPERDIRIFVEDEDPLLQATDIGPNPKICNMSRAYREAKGDIVWILDCNIWVNVGACGRVVDSLCGFAGPTEAAPSRSKNQQIVQYEHELRHQQARPYKLVAHLPVAVSIDSIPQDVLSSYKSPYPTVADHLNRGLSGALLDQSFLSSAHAKMYVAINTVAIAPCINGKSTAFRRSHLNFLTSGKGIDYFAQNICEDHLIGDLLWKSTISADPQAVLNITRVRGDSQDTETALNELCKTNPKKLAYRNHGLVLNDLALQPLSCMSVSSYVARRVRWLRVRKFTVPAATLVEPGTESLLCSFMGAWGLTTLSATQIWFGSTWIATFMWWLTSIVSWCVIDYFVFGILQGGGSVGPLHNDALRNGKLNTGSNCVDEPVGGWSLQRAKTSYSTSLPPFVKPPHPTLWWTNSPYLSFSTWLSAWLGRELLAFPVWVWAIWGGTTVTWRDQKFWVGMDMKVHAMSSDLDFGGTRKKD